VVVKSGGRVIGRSGGRDDGGRVDPWSHFVNVYMLDHEGRRIDRRNAQDIFVPLYDHQIPPGAADVVHYVLEVPPGTVKSRLHRAREALRDELVAAGASGETTESTIQKLLAAR